MNKILAILFCLFTIESVAQQADSTTNKTKQWIVRVGDAKPFSSTMSYNTSNESINYFDGTFFSLENYERKNDKDLQFGWRYNMEYKHGGYHFFNINNKDSITQTGNFKYLSQNIGASFIFSPKKWNRKFSLGFTAFTGLNIKLYKSETVNHSSSNSNSQPFRQYNQVPFSIGGSVNLSYQFPIAERNSLILGAELKTQSRELRTLNGQSAQLNAFVGITIPNKGHIERNRIIRLEKRIKRKTLRDSITTIFYPSSLKWAFGGGIGLQLPLYAQYINGYDGEIAYDKAATAWINAIRIKGKMQYSFRVKSSYREGRFNVRNDYSDNSAKVCVGNFKILRTEIGMVISKACGKHRNFFIGGGFYIGSASFVNTHANGYFVGGNNFIGGQFENSNSFYVLNKIYGGANFDMHQQFKLNSKNYLVAGANAQLESPESSWGNRTGKILDIYIAYKFYRK